MSTLSIQEVLSLKAGTRRVAMFKRLAPQKDGGCFSSTSQNENSFWIMLYMPVLLGGFDQLRCSA